jgi:hypothetical protein
LYVARDEEALSEYQRLVRKQIEVFEAQPQDVSTNAQGRVRHIVIGQVGIRCRHCSSIPLQERRKGAVYYPTRLDGVYQAAQHIAKAHLPDQCQHISEEIRQELSRLCECTRSSVGGGKMYWSTTISSQGVLEDQDRLRFI